MLPCLTRNKYILAALDGPECRVELNVVKTNISSWMKFQRMKETGADTDIEKQHREEDEEEEEGGERGGGGGTGRR